MTDPYRTSAKPEVKMKTPFPWMTVKYWATRIVIFSFLAFVFGGFGFRATACAEYNHQAANVREERSHWGMCRRVCRAVGGEIVRHRHGPTVGCEETKVDCWCAVNDMLLVVSEDGTMNAQPVIGKQPRR